MNTDPVLDEEEDELYEHYRLVADKGQGMMRLDKYLSLHIQNASRNKVQNGIDAGAIRVNDLPAKASYKVKPGDIVTMSLPKPPRNTDIIPENIPIEIVFEDDDLLVVNKPAGMVVHPAHGNWEGTLVNGLLYHFQNLPASSGDSIRPGLVHRIDKDTSGLLVVAKSEYAMTHLANQFFHHTTERTYIALLWGEMKEEKGTITGHVGRSTKDRKVMAVYPEGEQGKHAVTHYEVLKPLRYVSLVKCNLETGRTHQIRAHFQFRGHPLFNDAAYGGDRILRGLQGGSYKTFVENCFKILPRQALHAKSLGLEHPRTGEWMQFDTELPHDLAQVIEKWENYLNYN
jgi:23S rRNA pseudouridine1911/1915/1917 synthase